MRKHIVQASICVGALIGLMGMSKHVMVSWSSTLCEEKELAGMSFALEKYIKQTDLSDVVLPEDGTASEEASADGVSVEGVASEEGAMTEAGQPVNAGVGGEQAPTEGEAVPTEAVPAEAIPTEGGTTPTEAAPTEAIPPEGGTTPTEAAPTEAIPPEGGTTPTEAAPTEAIPPVGDAAPAEAIPAEAAPAGEVAPQPPEQIHEAESKFENVGISNAEEYVNIRQKPTTKSKVKGKLYRGAAAKIVDKKGGWVKIESGKVSGYIKAEHLSIGFSAEEMVERHGTKLATVNTKTLYVREDRSTSSVILTMVPEGETYEVTKEYDEWVKIVVDGTTKGYVAKEYVDMDVEFKQAISIKEERRRLRLAEEARRAEEEAAERLRQQQAAAAAQQAAAQQQQSSSSNNSAPSKPASSSSSNNNNSNKPKPAPSSSGSVTGSAIASYAQKFIGGPYVYSGTSLTNGADCSGFVQTVFRNHGISLPRTSSSQAGSGQAVSVGSARAGDLIFYASNGRINHVAICIGGGKVVHASNPRTGITISNMYYRTPHSARRVV